MNDVPNWITALAYVVVAITAIVAITTELRRYHSELLKQNSERLLLEREDSRRDEEIRQSQEKLSIERRRLTEANVAVDHELHVTHTGGQAPLAVFQLHVENIGDGPIDVWASLASARVLSDRFRPGIGRRSRDVTWDDYEPYYWDDSRPQGMFTGISTTKNMIASPGHFLRFVARERNSLRRIDAVSTPAVLQGSIPLYVMYRVFLVVRGYPLGEILRQVGGGPPDPLLTVPSEQLQFRMLGQPNYQLWRHVQEAVSNLVRLAFRLAIFERDELGSKDPLGVITEPDAWRFFLLHHEDFRGKVWKLQDDQLGTMDEFHQELLLRFFGGELPADIVTHPNFARAREYCAERLVAVVDKWTLLRAAIQECYDYPSKGYEGVIKTPVQPVSEFVKEGYPARIHTDREYRDKWLRLLTDGYLLSRPLPRKEKVDEEKKYDAKDIPPDPRILEPYVIRTYYFLETVQ